MWCHHLLCSNAATSRLVHSAPRFHIWLDVLYMQSLCSSIMSVLCVLTNKNPSICSVIPDFLFFNICHCFPIFLAPSITELNYLVQACPIRLLPLHFDFSNFLCTFLLLVHSQTTAVISLINYLTHADVELL